MTAEPDGWDTRNNAELIEMGILEIGDGYRAKNIELGKYGLPFLRISNVIDHIDTKSADILCDESVVKAGSKVSKPFDVVLTTKGSVGRFAYVKLHTRRFVYSPQLSYWRVLRKDVISPRFLYFWMYGKEYTNQAQKVKGLTDMADYVSLTDQRKMDITLPPYRIQLRISVVLSAYDDLIENNRRRIQLLEEMARALYREWFVHFRFPGHEDVDLVDSELGEIPEKWIITEISQIVSLERTGLNPRKHDNEVFAHYSFKACDKGKLPTFQYGKEINSIKYLVESDYILMSKLNPRILRIWMPILYHNERAIASTDFLTLKPKALYSASFVYCLLSSVEFLDHFTSMVTGTSTSHQRVKPKDFLKMKVLKYPEKIVQRFTELILQILLLSHNLRLDNEILSQLRDVLLPKLVSGQIDISNQDIEIPPDTHKTSKYSEQSTLDKWIDGDDKHDPS